MIDHVLGRPSIKFRKFQVFAVVSFWSLYLLRGDRHGPPVLRRISALFSKRLTAWQTLVITLLWLYVSRNFSKVMGLESPEPLANLYSRSYFRATWVTTALDAGFWTAMRIRRKWLRDVLSIVFTVYYMICAEQADEKVRRVRGALTVDHLRVSWNKGTTPYLSSLTKALRPKMMKYPPRAIRIPRPTASSYKDPVHAWLYFDGPISALKAHKKVILDIPGGGFVAMDPRNHDDKLIAWAWRTGLPVLSLDYRKAPEHPYPYALNECYDVYHTLIASRGRCIGLEGSCVPKLIVSGDSAGGNLAVGTVLMILQSGTTETRRWKGEQVLPPPEGVILVYPGLDMNIGNWMTDEQMALMRDRRVRKTNQGILRRKSDDYRKLTPDTPHHSDEEDEDEQKTNGVDSESTIRQSDLTLRAMSPTSPLTSAKPGAAHISAATSSSQNSKPQQLKTRLAMSSMISYFNDRILTPEMMRSMIILYIGPHMRPDFSTDFLLSPLLAPEALLQRFPKTYFLTGERDPLVDDTAIFAGRIRQAKLSLWQERQELGTLEPDEARDGFREEDYVEVLLVPGISHGFLQFVSLFPEGWRYINRCARWMRDVFERADAAEAAALEREAASRRRGPTGDYFSGSTPTRRGAAAADLGGSPPKLKLKPVDHPGSPTTANGTNGIAAATAVGDEGRPRHHRRSVTESSGDEDRPLEMTVRGSTGGARAPPASVRDRARRGRRRLSGSAGGSGGSGKRRGPASLASEEDLLGRRMKGLTGSLMDDGTDVPPTP